MSGPITLVPGRLHALPLVFGLDRPQSAFPATARGFGTQNCYLVEEGNQALLIDTGFPVFQEAVLEALETLLSPSAVLSVLVLRTTETASLGNLYAIVEHRRVDTVYAPNPEDFVHSFDTRNLSERGAGGGHERHFEPLNPPVNLDFAGTRRLEVFKPLLMMLRQLWLYDEATRTMFTSEYFGHHWSDSVDGPWIVDDRESDPTTVDSLCEFLRGGNRTWWLSGADGETLAGWLQETFATREVECIAPAFGAIIRGRARVERHVEMLKEALLRLGGEPLVIPGGER